MNKKLIKIPLLLILILIVVLQLVYCQKPKETPPEKKVMPKGIGVSIHGNLNEQEIKMMKKSGVKYVRVDLFWDVIEKQKGQYNFDQYDKLNKMLKENDIKPFYILDYSNKLYEKRNSIVTEKGRDAFGNYVRATVKHFKGQYAVWEIWNEPNLEMFWNNQPSYKDYGLLVEKVAPIIKKYDKTGVVVAPALSGISDDSLQWLEQLLKNKEVTTDLDAISVHPYRTSRPETALDDYNKLRKLIDKYSDKKLPILSGEWGYPVNARIDNIVITEQKQAELLVRMMLLNNSKDIPVSVWYDWRNDGTDPNNDQHNFGLLTHDYQPKQSYNALVNFNKVLKGYNFNKRLEYGQPNDYIFKFTSEKGKSVIVFWTTGPSHPITINFPSGKGKIVNIMGEEQPVNWNEKQIILNLSSSPSYLVIE
ncbi:cellulase family glycosylhydrolase [Priestia aryabhattai]|uniref:cellulase family glycosylhydrolase n=1 Tax=Priestia aryabhattai TaxID=412384 RepID=UPI001C8EF578|nr:cellulase family glycosylhydrolase [Priestia aryabhattai]MBX9988614.1 cellulase family glycosylhydrolase [Priestia aryabhattai]